ncbi:MAG: hypothetical protein GEV09_06190 [Pseudonocardiaceae bacterium]|nr:hypothetical protein [Pseudonocardiaceae bacterium]
MSGPLIMISHSKVKPGKLETYRAHWATAIDVVESAEPRMIAFHSYAAEDGTEVSTVQVHPGPESLDAHLKIFAEQLSDVAFEALDSYEMNLYGRPSEATLEFLGRIPGLRVRVQPVHDGGFLRPQPM